MPTSTYEKIATATGTGSAGDITFSTIPSTYTDLVLVANIFTTANANQTFKVNGSSSGYSNTWITGNGSTAVSSRNTSNNSFTTQVNIFAGSTEPAFTVMNFMNYANTSTYKTVLTRTSRASQAAEVFVGLWANTAAISSIVISGGTFTTNAVFTLYGIKAA
jgi:hypothetical protein